MNVVLFRKKCECFIWLVNFITIKWRVRERTHKRFKMLNIVVKRIIDVEFAFISIFFLIDTKIWFGFRNYCFEIRTV